MLFRLRFRYHAVVLIFALLSFSDALCLRLFLRLLNNLFFFTLFFVCSWSLCLFAFVGTAPGEEFFVIEYFLI